MKGKISIVLLAGLLVVGIAGALAVLVKGHGLFGTTDYIPWGILISSYEFLAASSTGLCMIAGLGLLLGIQPFADMAKRLLGLAAALMMGGFMIIGLELGNPLKAVHMMISPNFTSAIFWMVTLYGVYMALLMGTLLLLHKQQSGMVKAAAAVVTLVALVATANMGVLLGALQARPFWYGSFLPLYFIGTAVFSGMAFALICLCNRDGEEDDGIVQLVAPFRILTVAVAALVLFKMASALQGAALAKKEAAMALINGPLKLNFWLGEIGLGILIPLVVLFTRKGKGNWLLAAAVCGLVGVFIMRYDLVVAGLMVPLEIIDATVPSKGYLAYSPSLAELGIVAGGLGLAGLAYVILDRKVGLDKAITK